MGAPGKLFFPHEPAVYRARAAAEAATFQQLRSELRENPSADIYLRAKAAEARQAHWSALGSYQEHQAAGRAESVDSYRALLPQRARAASQARRAVSEPVSPELATLMSALQDADTRRQAGGGRPFHDVHDFVDQLLAGTRKSAAEIEADCAPQHEAPTVSNPEPRGTEMDYDRSLAQYAASTGFGSRLETDLLALRPDQTYLDSGVGQGVAMGEVLRRSSGRGVGIDLERTPQMDELERAHPGRFRFLGGNARDVELPNKLSVITDYFGPLSYAPELPQVLQRYLDALEQGGRLYVLFYNGGNSVVGREGKAKPINEYLLESHLEGLRVERAGRGLVLTKDAADAKLPPLALAGYTQWAPPLRYFYETAAAAEPQGHPPAGTHR